MPTERAHSLQRVCSVCAQRSPECPGIHRGADLSDCGTYRYTLRREWDGSGYTATFIMLNPSTADARVDDPTIRRCMGFARDWDYSRVIVLNLYALRATDPRDLWRHPCPVGEGTVNDACLMRVANHAAISGEPLIAAWGVNARPDRVRKVRQLVREAGASLSALGVTKDGHPRHPLYLPKTAVPTPWPPLRLAERAVGDGGAWNRYEEVTPRG